MPIGSPRAMTKLSGSQDAVCRSRLARFMGDGDDVGDDVSNIWASLPETLVMVSSSKADSLIAKFEEAGGTVRD